MELMSQQHEDVYQLFYNSLKEIRDLFHKSGRFDDANSKLDEIVKLISIYLYQIMYPENTNVNLRNLLQRYKIDRNFNIVSKLKEMFTVVAADQAFLNTDGTSIFGSNPQLAIHESDPEFAYRLLLLVVNSMDKALITNNNGHKFDLLNEAFGHFVRDNFRNHIEDAQYMTPPEVVDFMSRIALNDLTKGNANGDTLRVVDPCCGVGSFLSSFYRLSRATSEFPFKNIEIFGQDKVDRMVRLSKINLMLFNTPNHQISYGNSLIGYSDLDQLDESVDLILTNPPFGARFNSHEIRQQPSKHYPLLHDLSRTNGKNFPSELLFIDRCLSLLKPGGKLLTIVPDSVISAKGIFEIYRKRLGQYATVRMIVELPLVTFAQAGTRTKTHILYIEKHSKNKLFNKTYVFMGLSTQLGFDVKSRKGTPVKVRVGANDLPLIADEYIKAHSQFSKIEASYKMLHSSPSCVLVDSEHILKESWNPNHYNATRYKSISTIKQTAKSDVILMKLEDIVEFLSADRRKDIIKENSKCISVLHVMNEGVINYNELLTYRPKHPGINCYPGEILFSRINPRIPRVLVVPDVGFPLTCSTEFEIMNSKIHIDNYAIMMLLLSPLAQKQIQFLTSGTSSSHNRIKTKELKKVVLPVPKSGTATYDEFKSVVNEYAKSVISLNEIHMRLVSLKPKLVNTILNLPTPLPQDM